MGKWKDLATDRVEEVADRLHEEHPDWELEKVMNEARREVLGAWTEEEDVPW